MIDLYLKNVFSTRACWWYPSYVQEHSVVEALQQQRPESAGQFRHTPLSVSTNIDSAYIWKLLTLCELNFRMVERGNFSSVRKLRSRFSQIASRER